MPLIKKSTYTKPPFYLFNGHMETIIPSVWRTIEEVTYERERLELEDGDFLDLDWAKSGNNRLVVLTHGLEGNSDRHYVCLLYTSPSPRDQRGSRMPSSA